MTTLTCNCKVFLAEDNEVFAEYLKYLLNNSGYYDIHSFRTGEQLLQRINEKPEIVLLDYFLNSKIATALNGGEILKQIIKLFPETYVIMVSSVQEFDEVMELFKCGASDFIIKDEKVRSNLEIAMNRTRTILNSRSQIC
ncbi:MAG: response regulator [Bacteroidetes bacterium]|nr:response regulator [Bacteroidota bacterium]